jgi:O-acetyl-ADP-ribose deacetylase (regulator of RNase III)
VNAIKYVIGDATAPIGEGPQLIAHICNDQGGWGSGFVLAVSKRWPEPEEMYRSWARMGSGGGFRLGETQFAHVSLNHNIVVANMVAQRGFVTGDNRRAVDYDALRTCLETVALVATGSAVVFTPRSSVHMPRIGCGLGGGTWEEIELIITETLVNSGVDVTVYDLP